MKLACVADETKPRYRTILGFSFVCNAGYMKSILKKWRELIGIRRGDTSFRYQVGGFFMIHRQLEHVNA